MMATNPNYFNGQLRECQLSGIPFPVAHVMMNFGQDIAVHKYPNVPGAHVESLSRNPLTFSVRGVFINGLFRSETETWSDLYPKTFQAILRELNDDLNDNTSFQHPTLGKFRVKVVHGSVETSYDVRNGQFIDFELIEDGINDQKVQHNILGVDEIGNATQSAAGLDARLSQFKTANPQDGLPNISFSQLLQQAIAPVQQTSVAIGTAFAQASNAIAQVNMVKQKLFSLGNPNTSYMMIEMESINSALNDQRTNNARLNIFNVKTLMTLNQVLIKLLNYNNSLTIERLIALNPQLSVSAAIQPGTIVYWQ